MNYSIHFEMSEDSINWAHELQFLTHCTNDYQLKSAAMQYYIVDYFCDFKPKVGTISNIFFDIQIIFI